MVRIQRVIACVAEVVDARAAHARYFADRVQHSTPSPDPPRADGIVVLTGASSNQRIAAAVGLLEDGRGQRVLVSGVNPEASREDIRTVSKAVRRLYDCCVDLGFTAADTVGNARETAAWARAMRYNRLIVVTADYHMPRAMAEIGHQLPGVTLIAFPVFSEKLRAEPWWSSGATARLITLEYLKFLFSHVRMQVNPGIAA